MLLTADDASKSMSQRQFMRMSCQKIEQLDSSRVLSSKIPFSKTPVIVIPSGLTYLPLPWYYPFLNEPSYDPESVYYNLPSPANLELTNSP